VLDDYAAVVARAFAEPYTDELRALVRVCGDHFEHHGDPRGTLIALGEARHDATDRRARELQNSIDAHVLAYHQAELGGLADYVKQPRTCVLTWRCGQLFAAAIDARRLDTPADVIPTLLAAPAARTLRRLTVRMRGDGLVGRAVLALREAPALQRPPLEHALILREVRPRRLGNWSASQGNLVAHAYPQLHLYAERDTIFSLIVEDLPHDGPKLALKIHAIAAPLDDDARRLIGRALTSPEPIVRDAACDKLAQLGAHGAFFVDQLALLLQPGLVAPVPILRALAAMGPAARAALPVLVQLAGRAAHYDADARRAAGKLVSALRPSVESPREP
jgi:hypothetical protein